MKKSSKAFVGMDVHKESIDIAIGRAGGEVRHFGRIGGDVAAVARTVRKLVAVRGRWCSSTRPVRAGSGIYRGLAAPRACVLGGVAVADPEERAAIASRPTGATAMKLARLARAGELEPIYVPEAADEAMRDLVRAREDAVSCSARRASGCRRCCCATTSATSARRAWTQAHRRWICAPEAAPAGAADRLRGVRAGGAGGHRRGSSDWPRGDRGSGRAAGAGAPVVPALQALRGVQLIHAVRIVAELGDLTRFEHAAPADGLPGAGAQRALLRRAPAPGRDHQGGQQLRRAAPWSRRLGLSAPGARDPDHRPPPDRGCPRASLDIAWKAQLRLCARFRKLWPRGAEPATRSWSPLPASSPASSGPSASRSTASDGIEHPSHHQSPKGDNQRPQHSIQPDRQRGALAAGESSWNVIGSGSTPTPQILERGSSMTHNSLVLTNARISA